MTTQTPPKQTISTTFARLVQSFAIALIAITIILIRSARQPAAPAPSQHPQEYITLDTMSGTTYKLIDIVDGDTIRVGALPHHNKKTTHLIRLIGIDTPERRPVAKSNNKVECFGNEARNHLIALTRDSPTITIITDPSQGETDRYDRILGYAIRPSDGLLLNHALIIDGVADEFTYRRAYKYQREFRTAQRTAQTARRGKRSHCPQ